MRSRGVRTWRGIRSRRRRPRAYLVTVIAAYLFMLGGSPVGHAGYLWVHIATAHQASSQPLANMGGGDEAVHPAPATPELETQAAQPQPPLDEKPHDHERLHEEHHRTGEHHEHDAAAARHDEPAAKVDAPAAPAAALPAPNAAHEHGGVVHTHDGGTPTDLAIANDNLSKFFLTPLVSPDSPVVRDGFTAPTNPSAPEPAAIPIEIPPPRTPA